MPYVEGESLRQRLDKEQQLPVSDSVRIATEVASALDYAHRHNVIHRDIKPENILLHDGSAIVADFGIALAVTQAGGARITQTGLSLGTPGYMSPEQAMGERTITARSDIYSLGAVTYEMLAGEPPFTGPTVQAVVARVMTEEPRPLTTQRRNVPPNVAAAVSHALEKIPADRFASAHEFAEAVNNPSFILPSMSAVSNVTTDSNRLRGMLYGALALAFLLFLTTLWGWMRSAPPKQVLRYNLALDSAEAMAPGAFFSERFAISPDGSHLAYVGGPSAQLLVRARSDLHGTPVPGSEGAATPFFSPDGKNVGFVREKALEFAPVAGGPPTTVTDTLVGSAGASWGRDGFIYVDALSGGLLRVEAKAGSVPKAFTVLDSAKGELDHVWPDVLPNGKGVICTIISQNIAGRGPYAIGVADIPSGKVHLLVNGAMRAVYAASGHLLYVTPNRTLMMVPFDQNSMKITGETTPLVEGIRVSSYGSADLAVSETGTLIYATGAGTSKQELAWVTRDGKAQSVDPDWQGQFAWPTLSPDGKQLAVTVTTAATDIWVKQLDRGPNIKLTFKGYNYTASWTPDGQSVTFSSDADGKNIFELWINRADGKGQPRLLLHDNRELDNPIWSRDGKWVVAVSGQIGQNRSDFFGFRPGVDTVAMTLVTTARAVKTAPSLSPDGQWLAYASNESGHFEVYVVPFPNTEAAKYAVSTHGGAEPRWSHSGRELFYRDGGGYLVAVPVNTKPTFSVGRPVPLFQANGFRSSSNSAPQYDVSKDDRRFMMIRSIASNIPDKLIVVDNWFEELNGKSRK
jgi:serine/threonine-protein kinase